MLATAVGQLTTGELNGMEEDRKKIDIPIYIYYMNRTLVHQIKIEND